MSIRTHILLWVNLLVLLTGVLTGALCLGVMVRGVERRLVDDAVVNTATLMAQLNLLPGGEVKVAREAVDKALTMGLDEPPVHVKALMLRASLQQDRDQKLADLTEAVRLAPGEPPSTLTWRRAPGGGRMRLWRAATCRPGRKMRLCHQESCPQGSRIIRTPPYPQGGTRGLHSGRWWCRLAGLHPRGSFRSVSPTGVKGVF